MYILDASVLIEANESYYPIGRVPEFWVWLAHMATRGDIKIPGEIFDEITTKDEEMTRWLKKHKNDLILNDNDYHDHVSEVIEHYAGDLNEVEIEMVGKDPFLIAAAKEVGGTVVTKEVSKPSKTRANKKIPDICAELSVKCIDDHTLIREANFRTSDWVDGERRASKSSRASRGKKKTK